MKIEDRIKKEAEALIEELMNIVKEELPINNEWMSLTEQEREDKIKEYLSREEKANEQQDKKSKT